MANFHNPGNVVGTVLAVLVLVLIVAGFAAGRRAVVQGQGNVAAALNAVIGEKALESHDKTPVRPVQARTPQTDAGIPQPEPRHLARPRLTVLPGLPLVGPLQAASAQLGAPYRLGGTGPEAGFDCSGLTSHAFRAAGVELPRTSREQFAVGQSVARDGLAPGDLVFFKGRSGVSHVGIYQGGGRFIHSSRGGGEVGYDSLDAPYWDRTYAGARRVEGAAVSPPVPYAALAALPAGLAKPEFLGHPAPRLPAGLAVRGVAKYF